MLTAAELCAPARPLPRHAVGAERGPRDLARPQRASSTWRAWPRARTSASTAPSARRSRRPPCSWAGASPRWCARCAGTSRCRRPCSSWASSPGSPSPADDPTRFYALVDESYAQGRTRPPPPRSCARRSTTTSTRRMRWAPSPCSSSPTTRRSACSARRSASRRACRSSCCSSATGCSSAPSRRSTSSAAWASSSGPGSCPTASPSCWRSCCAARPACRSAEALLFPGRHTRLRNLGLRGRDAGVVVLGAVVMLLLAGLVEGVFRQTVHSVEIRLLVAALTALGWTAYFTSAGRRTPA